MDQRSQQPEPAGKLHASPRVAGTGPVGGVAPRPSRWDRADDAPAPPPVWTRYIESRLRQFEHDR